MWYSIIQYRPRPLRDERINVGLVYVDFAKDKWDCWSEVLVVAHRTTDLKRALILTPHLDSEKLASRLQTLCDQMEPHIADYFTDHHGSLSWFFQNIQQSSCRSDPHFVLTEFRELDSDFESFGLKFHDLVESV